MKTATVGFRESAIKDLQSIYDHIAEANGPVRADRYVNKVMAHCMKLSLFPGRGRPSDDISPGLRILPFEGRLTIAYRIDDAGVRVIRIFYAGRDYTDEDFSE